MHLVCDEVTYNMRSCQRFGQSASIAMQLMQINNAWIVEFHLEGKCDVNNIIGIFDYLVDPICFHLHECTSSFIF